MSGAGVDVWQQPLGPDGRPAEPVSPSGAHQPLRYVGPYHDAESGLNYHGARFYEPRIGRFISPDPAGIADAVNEVDHVVNAWQQSAARHLARVDPGRFAQSRPCLKISSLRS